MNNICLQRIRESYLIFNSIYQAEAVIFRDETKEHDLLVYIPDGSLGILRNVAYNTRRIPFPYMIYPP